MSKKTRKLTMWDVLDRIDAGWSDKQIIARFRITRASLTTYKSNLTRAGFSTR